MKSRSCGSFEEVRGAEQRQEVIAEAKDVYGDRCAAQFENRPNGATRIMDSGVAFEWDPRKAAVNLAKHGISFEEAASVFGDPLGRFMADPRHSSDEERFVLLGSRHETNA